MTSKYRQDKRSLKEFKADIKASSQIEQELLGKWLKSQGMPVLFELTGCGPNGEYLSDKNVSTKADFRVPNVGLIEVKFSKKVLKNVFHLKSQQIESYITQECLLLMVNGACTKEPTYILLGPNHLYEITKIYPIINWQGFGGKPSYRCNIKDFEWRPL